MNLSETFAFLFIAVGFLLIDQAIFFVDPIKALAIAGTGLIIIGCVIWFRTSPGR